jgi:fructokinase
VKPDRPEAPSLYLQEERPGLPIVVLGEVLWDLFEHSRRLGGAPLNFGAHARRLGHPVTLVSALGEDELGEPASRLIAALGLDTRLLQTTSRFPTGTAQVEIVPGGRTHFTIPRPAAYDAVEISEYELEILRRIAPRWFYYGTLFASTCHGKRVLHQLAGALRGASKFYDLNLRPGADSPELVQELLRRADVVKLNEDELHRVQQFTGLPSEIEAFCREGAGRYGWRAVGVTLGDRGCAIYADGRYAEATGHPVEVVNTVGAGDAFSAAFLHGLSSNWPITEIAAFANRLAAMVVSRGGAIPDWASEETVAGHEK